MGSVSPEDAIGRLNELMEKLSKVQAEIKDHGAAAEEARKAIIAKHGPAVDELTTTSEELVTEITDIFMEHRDHLLDEGSKTIVLRGGSLSARLAALALVVDESRAEKALRRLGKWRDYSNLQSRKLNKPMLKKNAELVAQLPDEVAKFVQNEHLIIKLATLQIEINRVIKPLRKRLNTAD